MRHRPSRTNFGAVFVGNGESANAERCVYAKVLRYLQSHHFCCVLLSHYHTPLGFEKLGTEIRPREPGCVICVIPGCVMCYPKGCGMCYPRGCDMCYPRASDTWYTVMSIFVAFHQRTHLLPPLPRLLTLLLVVCTVCTTARYCYRYCYRYCSCCCECYIAAVSCLYCGY